ncbi:protein serine/threonine phosphatase 2C [Patellaria atrata CBS 101060]|uniref:Protein serine/threonine phosphatase 2C n=1 Tax=Patellaria atrata CBS 101060 TaxID=1346257 RepID=A0A9P4SK20_9PEZI|nr:protein serine/threonine phosphatase 2C [Patellaria atrata CBS 101060]
MILERIVCHRRHFHDYFVTHLPSSSLHPDAGSSAGPHHKLPRDKSTPHVARDSTRSPAAPPPMVGPGREMTVVRIPLKSAKHHFGAFMSRGARPYNEDAYQAGTIEVPAFAKRRPISLTRNQKTGLIGEGTSADSASGDPQVFYFAVFDGHGGTECSAFLKAELHEYIEEGVKKFQLHSSLKKRRKEGQDNQGLSNKEQNPGDVEDKILAQAGKEALNAIEMKKPEGLAPLKPPKAGPADAPPNGKTEETSPPESESSINQSYNLRNAEELERNLVNAWKDLVGGYFKRFKPEYFSTAAGGQGHTLEKEVVRSKQLQPFVDPPEDDEGVGIETVLTYAFLQADYDFVTAQAVKKEEDPVLADKAINEDDILGSPSKSARPIGGPKRFMGGSTCSIAMISTPTPTPFWHPASPSTLVVSHVGDTRILLCKTSTGVAVPLTTNHHPSAPIEATRMRRYAATFVTDSFGEERVSGLANTRAFGDMSSKRIGVSAEPEIRRIDLSPAEYSFLVLVSDGVSGTLSDQETVDIIKEAKTPEQGARDVVSFATEIAEDADNATALVVRLGGWERRSEGGLGSLGTKELRDWRRQEAENPRSRRQ